MLVELSALASGVFVVEDGPLSFPVNPMVGFWILVGVSIGEAVQLLVLEEATKQEDDVWLKDNHPELKEEEVLQKMLVQFLASPLVSIAQPSTLQSSQNDDFSKIEENENRDRS